jgi:hypothetical protein
MDVKPLLFAGLVLVAMRASKKIDAVDRFKFSIDALPSVTYSNGGAVIGVPLGISNQTGEGFNIRSVSGRVTASDGYLGQINSVKPFVIEPHAHTTFILNLSVGLTNAVSSLISAILLKKNGLTISVEGNVVTDLLTVPYEVNKKFF